MTIGTRLAHGAAVVAVAVAIAGVARPASAQFDHLKCYKAKDQKTFKKATADLTALQAQFGVAESCEIKPAAKMFCVPATKDVTSIEDGIDAPFPAEDLAFDRLCYKIKCPQVTLSPEEVSDQFGTRTIDKLKAVMICTPTVLGPTPSTTTTTMGGCVDMDGDMYGPGCVLGPDCDDTQPSINPGAPEVCDGIDNDCSGMADDTCVAGANCCAGQCVDLISDPNNCGGCSLVCLTGANASPLCSGGACSLVCDPGYDNCNGSPGDGCEVNTQTDPNNCGACGNICPSALNSSASCISASCTFTCNPGYADCNGLAGDGCEIDLSSDHNNCGGCGLACGVTQSCVASTCVP